TSQFSCTSQPPGFGLLESGCVSQKNEVNILMKNAADVILGGLSYWVFGFGLQHGEDRGTTLFSGIGYFFVDSSGTEDMGLVFTKFIFQLSFSTTATTIVSGAMAERTNYNAYCVFSLLNTVVYCIPAGWLWADHGFLRKLGALDFAGSGCVHLLGGVSALVAAMFLGPRTNRYETKRAVLGNPINVVQGAFTLWWGWLVFNCGSTFGVTNNKWKYASRAAVNTINASLGGGFVGVAHSYFMHQKVLVPEFVNAVLAALVSVTAGSAFLSTFEALVVGFLGALLSARVPALLDRMRIDDPVGAVAVHAVGGAWGLFSIGLFIDTSPALPYYGDRKGLFKGGGVGLLAVQGLAFLSIALWSGVVTFILLSLINKFLPIRMTLTEEMLGADFVEHGIRHDNCDYSVTLQSLKEKGIAVDKLPRTADRAVWDQYICERFLESNEGLRSLLSPDDESSLLDVLKKKKAFSDDFRCQCGRGCVIL
ncbi:unnamed protein product, partial [Ixodes persulcatus]